MTYEAPPSCKINGTSIMQHIWQPRYTWHIWHLHHTTCIRYLRHATYLGCIRRVIQRAGTSVIWPIGGLNDWDFFALFNGHALCLVLFPSSVFCRSFNLRFNMSKVKVHLYRCGATSTPAVDDMWESERAENLSDCSVSYWHSNYFQKLRCWGPCRPIWALEKPFFHW